VINGRTIDPIAALRRKMDVWRTLIALGYPVHQLVLHIIPVSVAGYMSSKHDIAKSLLKELPVPEKKIVVAHPGAKPIVERV